MTLARCWNPVSAGAPVSVLSFSSKSLQVTVTVIPMSLERKYVPCEASSGVVGTCVWKERVVRVCVTRFSAFPRYPILCIPTFQARMGRVDGMGSWLRIRAD